MGNEWLRGGKAWAKMTAATLALAGITASGGATVNLQGETPSAGFAVSTFPQAERIIKGPVGLPAVWDYVSEHADHLEGGAYLGAWVDPETGWGYLDMSTIFEDIATAVRLGADAGQLAVFDLGRGEEVRITA